MQSNDNNHLHFVKRIRHLTIACFRKVFAITIEHFSKGVDLDTSENPLKHKLTSTEPKSKQFDSYYMQITNLK